MNINERARKAVAAYLQAYGMDVGDTIMMRLRENRAGAYRDVEVSGGGYIRTTTGHSVNWNRWTLGDFMEKIDTYLKALHDRRASHQQDMVVFRAQVERLEAKVKAPSHSTTYPGRGREWMTPV